MPVVVRSVRDRGYRARMAQASAPTGVDVGYSTEQAVRISKLTRRRVIYLREQGLVVPSLTRGGKRRYYAFADLIELTTVASLTRSDDRISISRVRKVVEALHKFKDRPLVHCKLVVADGTILWADEETQTLVDVVRGFQTTLVVHLDQIETDVRAAATAELTNRRVRERRAA